MARPIKKLYPGQLITAERLRASDACHLEVARFNHLYPNGLRVTRANIFEAADNHFSMHWLCYTMGWDRMVDVANTIGWDVREAMAETLDYVERSEVGQRAKARTLAYLIWEKIR